MVAKSFSRSARMRPKLQRGSAIRAETSSAFTSILPNALNPSCIPKNLTRRPECQIGGVLYSPSLEENSRAWLTEATASPALERGQYEKQMDLYWSCGSERVAWRRRSSREFLQSAQMDQKGPDPHGQ